MDKLLTLCSGIIIVFLLRRLVSKKPKYLPGPPGIPFFGNLFEIPETNSWELYTKWKETYGDAIHVKAMGNSIVVLNTYQTCVDLLDKRSDIYSDRPVSMMTSQLMGWWRAVTMAPYGDRWRRFRKITAQSMRKSAVHQYWPTQEREIKRFLGSLLQEPERYIENFRFASGRGLMRSVYGIDITSADDPIITIAEAAMKYATYAATPGTFLVDFFPTIQHIPSWIPGATFQKFAKAGRKLAQQMADIPFDQTREHMKNGNYQPSFTSINLENNEDEDIVRWCSGTMYTAGIDTTVASVHAFIMAMVRNPEVQKRAQAEVDAVVGTGRLPTLNDRDDLPYVNAVMKEVIRWQPVSPIALPHRVIKDDVYQGCFIPSGATVLANVWAITRDTSLYTNPEDFNPERFLPLFDKSIHCDPPPFDPINYAFGFGRRICGGLHYADSMLFLTIACLLSTFDLKPIKDGDGNDVFPEVRFNSHIVREALPFNCTVVPRPHAPPVIAAAQLTI